MNLADNRVYWTKPETENAVQREIRELLYSIGITEKYSGYFYLSYSLELIIETPDILSMVTKWLYPDVARRFRTNWKAVERALRTVVEVAWILRPEVLSYLGGKVLNARPTTTQFLTILSAGLRDRISSKRD